jgi:signal transduction histidine kinase
MKSVYAKILLWCFGMLMLALLAFGLVSVVVSMRGGGSMGVFHRMTLAAMAQARRAFETGGPSRLAETLDRLDEIFQAEFQLVDARNVNLRTGTDASALVALTQSRFGFPGRYNGRMVFSLNASDGRYRLLALVPERYEFLAYLPFYLVILATLAALCWALALSIASPLRRLTVAVDRFGAGDLSARVNSKRKDEIGRLSESFDRMGDRIETLVTAERRLLQDISHELRSPLSRLSFAAELVRGAKDPEAAAERVQKEVHRLASLVGALVEMTRAEGDPASRDFETVHLGLLLSEVLEDCRLDAEARACAVALEGDSDIPLHGDGELLRRAFENVIRNSIQYSPSGAKVEIRVERVADFVHLTVRDSGPGVPERDLAKIFQPFFRVDGSREAATGGVGLGLAIASRAIALHHGTIRARNASPGLLVEIELPLTARAAPR